MRISDWSSDVCSSDLAKGKVTKRYPQRLVQTPLEKLASLSPEQRNLRPHTTLERLQDEAAAISDNEAADRLQKARAALFESINRSAEHTSELQSLMSISYAVFCLKKKKEDK